MFVYIPEPLPRDRSYTMQTVEMLGRRGRGFGMVRCTRRTTDSAAMGFVDASSPFHLERESCADWKLEAQKGAFLTW